MTNEEKFVNELIGYIFAYPDDDYMTMECLCRKLHKYGLIEKKDGEWTTDFTDRKTESNSEIPNNCEHITEDGVTCAKYPACDDCLDNPLNKVKGSERLVKGTEQTEPQYSEDDMYWLSLAEDVANGKISDAGANQAWLEYINRKTEPTISKMEQVDKDINVRSKDEPQIQLTARCLNCNNAKACKEKHWEGCVYEPKDEKTCETCRHWKYIAHEWQCEACKCQGYEPKTEPQTETSTNSEKVQLTDEPQTDCAWK